MRELVAGSDEIVAIALWAEDGQLVARAGGADAVAPKSAPLTVGGEAVGTLTVSTTRPEPAGRAHP